MLWLSRLIHRVRAALTSLPLESLAVAAAVVGVWAIVASPHHQGAERFFFSAVVAVPLFYTVTMLRRAGRIRAGTAHALAAVAVLAAIAIGATQLDRDEAFAWQYGLGLLAACMLPFVAAATGPSGDRLVRFADFVRRFCEETTGSLLLCAAAVLAAAILFVSVQELFGLELEKLGVDTGAAIIGLCVLAYLHRLMAGGGPATVPELWRRLIARVVAPFLVAMLAILALYEFSVIARGELPANLISPLIIAAGAVGFASTLVIESLVAVRGERLLSPAEPHPWASSRAVRLSRGFAAVLLALLPLAGWALWLRIDQYGLTPVRVARGYALACLGLLAVWGTARWLRRRRPLTWEVPVAVGLTALAAAIGPLSVVDLSIRSQASRLEQALARAGVPSRTVMAAPPSYAIDIDAAARDEITESIGQLVYLGGTDALARVLDGHLDRCQWRWDARDCLAGLGVAMPAETVPRKTVWLAPADPEMAGLRYIEISTDSAAHDAVVGRIDIDVRGGRLVATRNGQPWASAALEPLDTWVAAGRLGAIPPLRDEANCIRAHAWARSATVEDGPNGSSLMRLELVLLAHAAPLCQ
jgi:hypothetical protein